MLAKQPESLLSSRPCEHHIITVHDLDHFFPGMQGYIGYSRNTQRRRGQNCMIDTIPDGNPGSLHTYRHTQANGQDLQPYPEYQEQHKRQPKRRRACYQKAVSLHRFIRPSALIHPGNRTQCESQYSGKNPGGNHQHKGVHQLNLQHIRHRLTV